ncbi:MAG TPA: PQQ-binding-like beta-propeller repeat protein [Trebonia sp.]|nr:PQQ-binding-like beta-propeller repeat protein [Trebonia sp.]
MRGTVLAAAACAVAACAGTGVAASGASGAATTGPATGSAARSATGPGIVQGTGTASSTGASWPQFDGNAARTGVAAGLPAAGNLTTAWSVRLDGAVYGQPLVVGREVIAATENDTVYALDRATGKTIWHTHVGTPVPLSALQCGDINPLGITGTPIYDAANGLVYAVAETTGYHHVLVALSAASGSVRLQRDLDIPTSSNRPANDQQRPALAIDDGRVYAAFGGLAGDCGTYQGSVVSAPLAGDGPLVSWHTPTSREGAIWAPGGPVTGPDGDLWVSIGNGAATSGAYDGSDSVTELTPGLRRVGYFAPSTWAADNAGDLDLGSTQPVLAPGGSVFIMGKRGVGYLLSAAHLGGIGGQVAQQSICAAFGTAAVSGSTVYEPCRNASMAAIDVDAATSAIKVRWRGPADANGSPVIGGGAVWVTHYSLTGGSGTLYELNPATGAVEHQITIPQGVPRFSSLALSGGTAYVSTLNGITAVNGA